MPDPLATEASMLVAQMGMIANAWLAHADKNSAGDPVCLELAKQIGFPAWVDVTSEKAEGVFKKSPDRDEFGSIWS